MSSKRPALVVFAVLAIVMGSLAFLAFGPSSPIGQNNPPPTPQYSWRINFTIQIIRHDNSIVDVVVPPNVGVAGGVWADHTLDSYGITGSRAAVFTQPKGNSTSSSTYDGFIYVSPTQLGHSFTLADFFNVWGQRISDSCIKVQGVIDKCTGYDGSLVLEVDKTVTGQIQNHRFQNGEEIWLAYIES